MFLLTLLLYWSLHHMSYVFCFLLNLYTFTLWCMLRRHYMYHCINMHHFLLCDTNRDIQIYQSIFIKDIVNLFFQKKTYPGHFQVCYYGQHYHCFAYSRDHEQWIMYDDQNVKVQYPKTYPGYSLSLSLCFISLSWLGNWWLEWCYYNVRKRTSTTPTPFVWSCKLVIHGVWICYSRLLKNRATCCQCLI